MAREVYKYIEGKLCISSQIMQDIFAVSRATLGNWAQQGCPKARAGWWPLADVIKWKYGSGSNGDVSDEALKKKFDAEYKREMSLKVKMQNEVSQENYVHKDDLTITLTGFFAELKRSFTAFQRTISQEVAQHVDTTSARRINREYELLTRDFLRRLASGVEYGAPRKRKRRQT